MGCNRVIVTRHLRNRMRERFSGIYQGIKHDFEYSIRKLIDEGDISRSFLNNSSFMNHLYETYGYGHTYDFVVNGRVVFVVKKKDGQNIAVTCLNKKGIDYINQAPKFLSGAKIIG